MRIKDLGQVVRAHKEREILTRTDGGESVQIEIYKEGDANIVALAGRVRSALGRVRPGRRGRGRGRARGRPARAARPAAASRPGGARSSDEEGAQLKLVADRSLFIESSIREVRNTAILGGLLAVLVLYLFLRNGSRAPRSSR